MILITGAAGKTGQAIIQALADSGEPIRALVHAIEQRPLVERLGVAETVAGDMSRSTVWPAAARGVRAIYHICSNMSPDELSIGRLALDAAQTAGVERFVYHSVLHPQVEAMPHHWQKMRMEEAILAAGLPFVILQPAAYMQNILAYWPGVVQEGVFRLPFPTATRLSLVDLVDVAWVAAKVLVEDGHDYGIYELCSPDAPSQEEVASIMAEKLCRPVRVEEMSLTEWRAQNSGGTLGPYQIESLSQMFDYYARHNFRGSPQVLSWLLQRRPTDLATLISDWAANARAAGE